MVSKKLKKNCYCWIIKHKKSNHPIMQGVYDNKLEPKKRLNGFYTKENYEIVKCKLIVTK